MRLFLIFFLVYLILIYLNRKCGGYLVESRYYCRIVIAANRHCFLDVIFTKQLVAAAIRTISHSINVFSGLLCRLRSAQ